MIIVLLVLREAKKKSTATGYNGENRYRWDHGLCCGCCGRSHLCTQQIVVTVSAWCISSFMSSLREFRCYVWAEFHWRISFRRCSFPLIYSLSRSVSLSLSIEICCTSCLSKVTAQVSMCSSLWVLLHSRHFSGNPANTVSVFFFNVQRWAWRLLSLVFERKF